MGGANKNMREREPESSSIIEAGQSQRRRINSCALVVPVGCRDKLDWKFYLTWVLMELDNSQRLTLYSACYGSGVI